MHAQNGVKIALPKQFACTIRYNTYQVPGNLKKVQFSIRFHLLRADNNNNTYIAPYIAPKPFTISKYLENK